MTKVEELENERKVENILFDYLETKSVPLEEVMKLSELEKLTKESHYTVRIWDRNENHSYSGVITALHRHQHPNSDKQEDIYFSVESDVDKVSLTSLYYEDYKKTWYIEKE